MSHPYSESVVTRFWKHVDRRGEDECWPWIGHKKEEGYGLLFEKLGEKRHHVTAHRVSYQVAKNITITSEVIVRHKCDNPPCCNPKHLVAGKILDNVKDRQDRSRQAKGTSIFTAKATEEIVIAIRAEYRPYKVTLKSLAEKYGLCLRQVWVIVSRKNWRHI